MSDRNRSASQREANRQGANRQTGGQSVAPQDGPVGGGYRDGRQHATRRRGGGTDLTGPVKLGLGTFALVGFGVAVTMFLFIALMPALGSGFGGTSMLGLLGGGGGLSGALFVGLFIVIFTGPVVATGLGGFLGHAAGAGESGPLAGGAASAIGAGVTIVLLVVLAILFAPGGGSGGSGGTGMNGLGALLGPLVGALIGIALTGAGAGFVGQTLTDG